MRFKADVGSSPPPFKRVVMWTGTLACPLLGRKNERRLNDLPFSDGDTAKLEKERFL